MKTILHKRGLEANLKIAQPSEFVYTTDTEKMLYGGNGKNIEIAKISDLNTISAVLLDHRNDKNNPHGVTKSQVGLGNVQDYGIATTEEAEAGTSDTKYMTPLKTKNAMDTLTVAIENALGPINSHVINKDNPHGVTKAQVGLGNVQNFAIATEAEALAGTATDKYVTVATAQKMIEQAINQLRTELTEIIG